MDIPDCVGRRQVGSYLSGVGVLSLRDLRAGFELVVDVVVLLAGVPVLEGSASCSSLVGARP